jgi:hypothetical protein
MIEFMLSEKNIKEVIQSRQDLSSNGNDGVGYRIIKAAGQEGVKFMKLIIEATIRCKKVFKSGKEARTILIFKKGREDDISNWRPAQFQQFRLPLMQVGADIQRQYSGLNFAGIFQRPSPVHMSKLLNHLGKKQYEEQLCLAVRDVKFVSMQCDAGTVNKFKAIHPMILKPSCFSSSIPLLARTNKSFTSDDYLQYFQDTSRVLIELGFEICGVLCDNLPPKSKD